MEDNPLWWLVGWLLTIGVLIVLAILAVGYLAGVALGHWVEGRLEARARRQVQARTPIR